MLKYLFSRELYSYHLSYSPHQIQFPYCLTLLTTCQPLTASLSPRDYCYSPSLNVRDSYYLFIPPTLHKNPCFPYCLTFLTIRQLLIVPRRQDHSAMIFTFTYSYYFSIPPTLHSKSMFSILLNTSTDLPAPDSTSLSRLRDY
jgi:hypothetical protein